MIALVGLVRPIRLIIPLPSLNQRSRPLCPLPLILLSFLRSSQHNLLLLGRHASISIHLLAHMRPVRCVHNLRIILRSMARATNLSWHILVLGVRTSWLVEELVRGASASWVFLVLVRW